MVLKEKYFSCYISVNPFQVNVSILYPLKHQKAFGFLVFSGNTKWEHWLETVTVMRFENPYLFSCSYKHNTLAISHY